jgi:acyl-CoA thioester hydrolase
MPHSFDVQIYYEDTDFSGVVYHANYLRYFERAREHALGTERLVQLWAEEGKGFVVYKASLAYKEGAVFGDTVVIESTASMPSPFRVVFAQRCVRKRDGKLLVTGEIEMVCIDKARRPIPIPIDAADLARMA